jgi:hypothetical protein
MHSCFACVLSLLLLFCCLLLTARGQVETDKAGGIIVDGSFKVRLLKNNTSHIIYFSHYLLRQAFKVMKGKGHACWGQSMEDDVRGRA